ncbi:protein SCAR3-like [Iris pallida]|uniref:Protein SCAR n=1 Tax=Iris pallida TaxID=29817 RepID=A0AAX6ICA6_IRIPA|nr:protein SCAR3-like [Iris pallida]
MPLVRFEVKNEYGLSDPELYRGKEEDPGPALDALTVAGLVGILRQLGDLAEFAADVFHDLHEQVTNTGVRGQKISSRIQRIESGLPSLEKAVKNQRSHIHFAYIAGCDWRATIRTEQRQLICSDLPQYVLDSYEECFDPPRLHLLDKFDSAGAGACLRRYSDPSYFRRAIASSEPVKLEKVKRKRKKKGSRLRRREIQEVFTPRESISTQFASPGTDHLSFSVENSYMSDMISNSEVERESALLDSETRVNFQVADTPSMVQNELEYIGSPPSASNINPSDDLVSVLHNDPVKDTHNVPVKDTTDDEPQDSMQQESVPSSCSVTWDEKTEIVKPTSPKMVNEALVDRVEDLESLPLNFVSSNLGCENAMVGNINQEYIEFQIETIPVSSTSGNHLDEVNSEKENYMDANTILESETDKDGECQTKQEPKSLSNFSNGDSKFYMSELKERTASSLYCNDAQSPAASCSSTTDYLCPGLSNLIVADGFDHGQSMCATDFIPKCDSVGSECQTKQDLKSLSNFSNGDLKYEISELKENTASSLDCIDAQSPAASCSSAIDYLSPRLSNLTAVNGFDHDQSMCTTDFVTKHDSSVECDYSGSHIPNVSGVSGSEGLNAESSNVNEQSELFEVTKAKIFKPEDPLAASLRVPSFSCWTNGAILGVAPSKPPDFGLLHGRSVANSEAPDMSRENMTNSQNSQESFQGPSHVPGFANAESQYNGCDQSISASISHLAHKFLANNLQRRISINHADVPTPSELMNGDFKKSQEIPLQNEHQELPNGFLHHASRALDKEKVEVGSSGKSVSTSPNPGSSSPPMEHMKISFHSMNGLQTSKLNLEFSSGNLHESVRDLTFPSFRLIYGPSTCLLDSGSESDDDTFCRSSYSSQDILSPRSESNSDLWGEDERNGSQKHELSDDSCRISSPTTFISSSLEFEKMDGCSIYPVPESENLEDESGTVAFGSDPIRDLPDIDFMIFAKKQHKERCNSLSVVPIDSKPLSPNELPLPRLPPMQWRVVKPSSSLEHKRFAFDDVVNHLNALIPSSVILKPKEEDALRASHNAEAVTHCIMKTQNLNGHKEHNHTFNGKEPDEKEELLHQIGSKAII